MEKVFYHDFAFDAQYIGYWNGIKIFVYQDRLLLTKDDNKVVKSFDLFSIIANQIDNITKSL